MFRNVLIILALILPVLPGSGAQAGTRFENAVELWLQGDDAQSLPMLAELAADGNTDARLLLGRIESADLGPSPYRLSLSPAQSRELFRQKNGSTFGRSWLSVEAAAGNERAQALLRSKRPEPDPQLITQLNQLGEHQATDYPTRIVALYGNQDMRQRLLTNSGLMPDLTPYLAYLTGTPEPRGDGLAALRHIQPESAPQVNDSAPQALGMAGVLALGLGFGDISPSNRWRPAVENWLMSAESARPIAGLCSTRCGDEAPACAFAFLALSGGYFEAIRFDSPLEMAIPQQQFLDSPRARLMVLRKAVLARTETNLDWLSESADVAGISACAAGLIQEERQAYQ